MYMPTKHIQLIHKQLFNDGVLTAEKKLEAKHPDLNIPNLHVIKLMQSMASRGFVRSQFNWQVHYWFLTDEGIAYLREALHLPAEVVPATLKRPRSLAAERPSHRTPEGMDRDRSGRFGGGDRPSRFDSRQGYRRAEPGGEMKSTPRQRFGPQPGSK
jgi:small subunit ribosomal protein S10e